MGLIVDSVCDLCCDACTYGVCGKVAEYLLCDCLQFYGRKSHDFAFKRFFALRLNFVCGAVSQRVSYAQSEAFFFEVLFSTRQIL